MKLAAAGILVFCLALADSADAGRGPLACLAPTRTADAARPITEIGSLELYVDEGDPLRSYGNALVLVSSRKDGDGRTRNDYRVGPMEDVRGTIVFAGDTPISFAIAPLKRTYVSLSRNEAETVSMADAVPGIVCYTVEVEQNTF